MTQVLMFLGGWFGVSLVSGVLVGRLLRQRSGATHPEARGPFALASTLEAEAQAEEAPSTEMVSPAQVATRLGAR